LATIAPKASFGLSIVDPFMPSPSASWVQRFALVVN
jgi:hypothetical protein